MVKKTLKVEDFSATLFWDVDKAQVDFEAHRDFVIEKALLHGTWADFLLILNAYGKDVIKKCVQKLRYMDNRTMHFVSVYFGIPKTDLRCYTTKQSNLTHWDY